MKNSIISIILSGLLVGTGTYLIIARKFNTHLSNALKAANSKSDSLNYDKKVLHRKSVALKKQVDSLNDANHTLLSDLANAKSSLAKEDQSVIRLTKSFKEMNKKCDDFLILQKNWDKDRAEAKTLKVKLESENKELANQVAALSEANRKISTELSVAKLLEKDNITIARLDKNNRPNVNAKKIKKIMVSMSLPSEMVAPEFKIFDADGNPLPNQDGTFTSNFQNETNVFGSKATRLELTYSLSKKIGSGSYHVEIANEGKHMGNLFMSFR